MPNAIQLILQDEEHPERWFLLIIFDNLMNIDFNFRKMSYLRFCRVRTSFSVIVKFISTADIENER